MRAPGLRLLRDVASTRLTGISAKASAAIRAAQHAAIFVVVIVASGPCVAATMTQTASFSFPHAGSVSTGLVSVGGSFNRSQVTTPAPVTVPRFDPALGTLTGVSVSIQTSTASFAVSPSGLLSLVSNASATRTLAYATTAGTLNDSGSNASTNSGLALITLLQLGSAEIGGASLAAARTYSLAADLAQFSGSGSVSVAFTATDALSVTTTVSAVNGAGFGGSGTYAGNVSVSYTYTPVQAVYGTVYADTNHNRVLDGSEAGIGQASYVKLAPYASGCQAPATVAVAANPTTGAWSFGNVTAGSYCLILDDNATLADVTPTRPSGWSGTETPGGIRTIVIATAPLGPQNFGLYHGASVTGTVFSDTGVAGGTANDGVPNGGEPGLVGTTVTLAQGATTIDATTTDSGGAYTLWSPSGTTGSVTVTAGLSTGLLATGGSAGTSGGTYVRATNTTTFTVAAGSSVSNVNFGAVPVNALQPDGAQTTGAGSTVVYAHAFVAGSSGQVTFSTMAAPTPSSVHWTEAIYLDTNCNGIVDAGEPLVTGAMSVTAGQRVCLLVKEYAPSNAPLDAHDAVTLTATMTYVNATPALATTVSRTDTTTVGNATLLTLGKQVRNLTTGSGYGTVNNASPNDLLEYQLNATNLSSGVVASVIVNDATPAYTTFVSAVCPGSLPANVGTCTVTAQPAAGGSGNVQFTFSGLGSGSSVTVTFQVRVLQ